eukprot:IDg13196t1
MYARSRCAQPIMIGYGAGRIPFNLGRLHLCLRPLVAYRRSSTTGTSSVRTAKSMICQHQTTGNLS